MAPHVTNGSIHLYNMFDAARTLLKKPTSRMDKKCGLCEKNFPVNLKAHIKDVHDGLKTPWELWLRGFFYNNWFMHIGKRENVFTLFSFLAYYSSSGCVSE